MDPIEVFPRKVDLGTVWVENTFPVVILTLSIILMAI